MFRTRGAHAQSGPGSGGRGSPPAAPGGRARPAASGPGACEHGGRWRGGQGAGAGVLSAAADPRAPREPRDIAPGVSSRGHAPCYPPEKEM